MKNDYTIYIKKDNVNNCGENGVNVDEWLKMLVGIAYVSFETLIYKRQMSNIEVLKVEINDIHWSDNHWKHDKMTEAAIKCKTWQEYMMLLHPHNPTLTDMLYLIQKLIRPEDILVIFKIDNEICFNGFLSSTMNKTNNIMICHE